MENDRFLLLQIPQELKASAVEEEYPVYATRFGEHWVAYRVLSYGEYKKALKAKRIYDAYSYNKYLADLCVIYPKSIDKFPAFWIPKLSEHIQEVSGFENIEAFYSSLDYSRKKMEELECGIDVFLKTIIGIEDSKMDNMPFLERMKMVALAELVSGKEIPGIKPNKKRVPIKGFDESSIPGLGNKTHNEQISSVDKLGRPTRISENEGFTVYNTTLKK